MFKRLIYSVIFFSAVFLILPSAAIAEDDSSTITSTAMASTEVEPDTASFSAAVVTENKNLDRAIEENNKKSQKVYDSLKGLLGDKGKIKTSSFRVSPMYEYNKAVRKNELRGYRVSNQIFVETKKLDKIGAFLQTATENGSNRINDLSFTVENQEKYCSELLEKAAVKARKKAEAVAKALGVKITGIKRVHSSCNKPPMPPIAFGAGLMAEKSADIPIETGDVNMNASITIDFLIEN